MDSATAALAADIVNGFFGGLAAAGVNCINPRPAEFEAAFSRAWAEWQPASSGELATFTTGRYGYKALLYHARGPRSLFQHYRISIDSLPQGLTVQQVLNGCAEHATADQWRDLALLYLRHAGRAPEVPSPEQDDSKGKLPHQAPQFVPAVRRNGIRVPGGIIRRSSSTF